MPSKQDKKGSSSKKSEKGSVGVFYQGLLKSKGSLLFYSDNKEPEEEFEAAKKYYGTYTKARYVVCEEPEKIFNKVAKSFEGVNEFENLYESNSSSMIEKIKEEAGVKTAKTMGETKKKTVKADDGSGAEDGSENENASGDESAESEDEKPVKVSKSSKSGKKEKEEPVKETKESKKSGKSGKKS